MKLSNVKIYIYDKNNTFISAIFDSFSSITQAVAIIIYKFRNYDVSHIAIYFRDCDAFYGEFKVFPSGNFRRLKTLHF